MYIQIDIMRPEFQASFNHQPKIKSDYLAKEKEVSIKQNGLHIFH